MGASASFRDFQVGGFHIFTLLAIVTAMFSVRRPATQQQALRTAIWMVIGAGLIAMTVFTGDFVGYPKLGGQLMALAVSAALLGLTLTPRETREVIRGFLILATASSAFAVLQGIGVVHTRMYVDYSGLERPTGFVAEPDWVAGFAVAAIALLLSREWRRSWPWRFAMLLNLTATVICLARGSWLALLAVVLVALAAPTQRPSGVRLSRARIAAIGALLVAIVVSAPWAFAATARARFLSIFFAQHRDENTSFRQGQIDSLIELIKSSPWFGHGLSAQGRVTILGDISDASRGGGVATNWALGLLADAGVLALPLIVTMLVLVWRHRRRPEGLMLLAVLVTSMFSNLFFVPVVWLAVAACIAGENSPDKHPNEPSPPDRQAGAARIRPARAATIRPTGSVPPA